MKRIFLFAFAAIATLTSCSDDDDQAVTPVGSSKSAITFDARVGNEDFALNKNFTIGSRTYNFTKLRYWVSNIILVDTKGTEYVVPNAYYLMEEVGDLDLSGTINGSLTYPARKRETIELADIPEGEYKSIKFSIGIDAKHNDNLSIQSGELSIANGMSNIAWMWHTSYIFSSVGGKVTEGANSAIFNAETGLNTNYKTLSMELATPVNFQTAKSVVVNLDVAKLVDGIDLITTPTVNAAKPEMMAALAGNYATKALTFSSISK